MQSLHSLKVSKRERKLDATDATRVVVTTKTLTYSMNRDICNNIFQLFINARLVEDATNRRCAQISAKSIYVATPKGLHVVECYARDNSIGDEHLHHVFATRPICTRLLHFTRREADDQIVDRYDTLLAAFRRFAGEAPNYAPAKFDALHASEKYREWSKGVLLTRIWVDTDDEEDDDETPPETGVRHIACFSAPSAVEWLCDFVAVTGKLEAGHLLAHFVRCGLIHMVKGQSNAGNPAPVVAQGKPGVPNSSVAVRFIS